MPTIAKFTDLDAWKQAHKLVIQVYKITDKFPKAELYGLTSQMRRCSLSISSNIAEGFSRQSNNEKAQFYHIAKGSLTELQNQLLVVKDVKYISQTVFKDTASQTTRVGKLITGLIKSAKKRK